MSISSIGAQSALIMNQLVQMRAKFDDLQRQLGTGHKSATYAGLGIDRGVTVSLNSQLSAISSYDDTIQNVMARINLMNTALGNMIDISSQVKAAMVQANGVSNGSGAEVAQQTGKTVPQIALNWLLQRPTVATLIIGARNEEQLRQNLGAVGWSLTREQVAALDAASATTKVYPYWHQAAFTERNPPPV